MVQAILVPVVMLVFVTLIYRRIAAGQVLAAGDLQLYFFPYWTAVVRSIRAGSLPLWNPYLFAGSPLLANSQVGVFYPLNWPFWLLSSSSLPGIAHAIHWSVVLHLWLAAASVYILCRRTSAIGRWPSALAGIVYAGGGFLGVHIDHLNQLQALAWLPLLFLPEVPWGGQRHRRGRGAGLEGLGRSVPRWLRLPNPLSILAFAMILLTGHTQMAFIGACGLAIWHLVRSRWGTGASLQIGRWFLGFVVRMTPFALAGLIAAVQLLPTLTLARLSGRGGGLDWREAVSFSLPPWELAKVVLPPYITPPLLPEGVAYLGVPGLLLAALGGWRSLRALTPSRSGGTSRTRSGEGPARGVWLVVAAIGFLLALGGYDPLYLAAVRLGVPGLVHFRAPARFLALYVLAGSVLAGIGLEWLSTLSFPAGRGAHATSVSRRFVTLLAIAVVGVELMVSGRYLPHGRATTPQAYTDLRPATADLVAATRADSDAGTVPGRFLSISQTLFEVGDKAEIETAYAGALDSEALMSYLVATKEREVLAPNLPLAFEVPAVDGYDGGLLPLRSYTAFSKLVLPEGTIDGRLRENLADIPEARWLELMGAQYLLTDKTTDVWIDDILYDRQFHPTLEPGQTLDVAWLPEDFPANALGLLYTGGGGEVDLRLVDGRALSLQLSPSDDPHEVRWIRWDDAVPLRSLSIIASSASAGPLALGGASLADSRTGAFYPVVLSDVYRLVHSGDVKIYEALTPPARAFLAHRSCTVPTEDNVLSLMRGPEYDPSQVVALIGTPFPGETCDLASGPSTVVGESVSVIRYDATEVTIDVVAKTSGYLVLTDTWYPGWTATREPLSTVASAEPVEISQADVLFRAVRIDPGTWRVTFSYRPVSHIIGAAISFAGLVTLALYTLSATRSVKVRNRV